MLRRLLPCGRWVARPASLGGRPEAFIERFGTHLHEAYGIVQKEYVTVPGDLRADTSALPPLTRWSDQVRAFLTEQGAQPGEISEGPISTDALTSNAGRLTGYRRSRSFEVRSAREEPRAAPEGGGDAHMQMLPKLARALMKKDFKAALADFDSPQQNITFADADGAVGFVAFGAQLLHQAGDRRRGWAGLHDNALTATNIKASTMPTSRAIVVTWAPSTSRAGIRTGPSSSRC